MRIVNIYKRKELKYFVLIILVILLGFNFFLVNSNARKETISGFSTQDIIQPNEKVSYNFLNNLTFEVSTDVLINLSIDFDNNLENRQTFFTVNSTNSISLNVSSKTNMQNFGVMQPPQSPQKGSFRYQYRYNCIFKIRVNSTIENLTIRYRKIQQYGINPDASYSLALYESSQHSWQIIETVDTFNETSSENYLESSLVDLQPFNDYYITLYEVEMVQEDWTWLIITGSVIIFAIITLVVAISKKDYFQYLRTRTVPIEKGAHRLSLDEVLENENRNKIIDLILNEPGIHFNELLRRTGLAAGNLVWHLDILLTYKVIGKKRIGNFIAYFPYYQKNPISNVDLKLQKSKLTIEILEMIEKNPGVWNNLITKEFKVDHKTIQYHLNKLIELGLIKFEKDGRKK
ncbi:MAG: winged helix-turn-helix transcriptional regulator, partial [Candidatus Lokiarchaeia archaeon]|nr:winged helix-turn-helix transcriptional regulator [Candidatus Lokiarchaeia archaeon]